MPWASTERHKEYIELCRLIYSNSQIKDQAMVEHWQKLALKHRDEYWIESAKMTEQNNKEDL